MVIFKPLSFGVVCYAAIANRSIRQGRQVLEKRRRPHKDKENWPRVGRGATPEAKQRVLNRLHPNRSWVLRILIMWV